jgi:hypothetical protein
MNQINISNYFEKTFNSAIKRRYLLRWPCILEPGILINAGCFEISHKINTKNIIYIDRVHEFHYLSLNSKTIIIVK